MNAGISIQTFGDLSVGFSSMGNVNICSLQVSSCSTPPFTRTMQAGILIPSARTTADQGASDGLEGAFDSRQRLQIN